MTRFMKTGSNTLNQITHMQFDFRTPKSLKITPTEGKKKKKQRERRAKNAGYQRVEDKKD